MPTICGFRGRGMGAPPSSWVFKSSGRAPIPLPLRPNIAEETDRGRNYRPWFSRLSARCPEMGSITVSPFIVGRWLREDRGPRPDDLNTHEEGRGPLSSRYRRSQNAGLSCAKRTACPALFATRSTSPNTNTAFGSCLLQCLVPRCQRQAGGQRRIKVEGVVTGQLVPDGEGM